MHSLVSYHGSLLYTALLILFVSSIPVQAQVITPDVYFDYITMDIGRLQHNYRTIGAFDEAARGMEWPAELKGSKSVRSEALWLGVKEWTSPDSTALSYSVVRVGPRNFDPDTVIPISSRVVTRWERPDIMINDIAYSEVPGGKTEYEVDPSLPSDQMIEIVFRTALGVEVSQKIYAYSNPYHDDYHIIERTFTNTGNVDGDDDIELQGQTLNELMVFNAWRWTGREEAGMVGLQAQQWGKFNMIDMVGDGNEVYPVDFTAIYSWAGHDPQQTQEWNLLGSPVYSPSIFYRDVEGRLAGMSMQGVVVLHADTAPGDPTYDALMQPRTLGWMDMDEELNGDGQEDRDYYELGILTRENPEFVPGRSSRMYPHYADRVVPDGNFWSSSGDASQGIQGGHGATMAYGPYQLEFGEQVRVVDALVSNGLSLEASDVIGRAYNAAGFDNDALIPYDANKDGSIDNTPFDYTVVNNGAEVMTKNQWYLSSRDSLFTSMQRAIDLYAASNSMTTYPVLDLPPPASFNITSHQDRIELSWEAREGLSNPDSWEIYRTDSLYQNLVYERIAVLGGAERSYKDLDVLADEKYFYYLQAVSAPQNDDPAAIEGTPGGAPLRSSRYLTQTKVEARLFEPAETPDFVKLVGTGKQNDLFGSLVSVSGNYVAANATRDDMSGEDNGAVYIFEQQLDGTWKEDAQIYLPPARVEGIEDLNRQFGSNILFHEDQLFIRDEKDDESAEDAGALYVYERNETSEWVQVDKLVVPGLGSDQIRHGLGYSMAAEGDVLLVSNNTDSDRFPAVYSFERMANGTWEFIGQLEKPESVDLEGFGRNVSLKLPFAFVAAEGLFASESSPGFSIDQDVVLVYERLENSTWIERQLLKIDKVSSGFGDNINAEEAQVFISASSFEVGSTREGAVFIYEYMESDSVWVQEQVLTVPMDQGEDLSLFGLSMAVAGENALIRARNSDRKNRVFLYKKQPDRTWLLDNELMGVGGYEAQFRQFGIDVHLSGDVAIVAAPSGKNFVKGAIYAYELDQISTTSIEDWNESSDEVPAAFSLSQNYPNPFNPSTTIEYEVPEAEVLRIELYDALGRRVRVLAEGMHTPGKYEIVFEGSSLASGTYFYQLKTPTKRFTRSMMLLK